MGVAVHVVARHSQSTRHHHTFDGAPAAVLGARRAAIISIRFPEEQSSSQKTNARYSSRTLDSVI